MRSSSALHKKVAYPALYLTLSQTEYCLLLSSNYTQVYAVLIFETQSEHLFNINFTLLSHNLVKQSTGIVLLLILQLSLACLHELTRVM